jgi:hypothetical protein
MMDKKIVAAVLALTIVLAGFSTIVPVFAEVDTQGPPDIQRKIFIHYAKDSAKPAPSISKGFYSLIGVKWKTYPVQLEVNTYNPSGLPQDFVLQAIGMAAEEWDNGAFSEWGV